ncbi:MAG: phosphate/phosphonate ABC transporter permease [bacterium]
MIANAPAPPARPPLSPGRFALLIAAGAALLASLRISEVNPALLFAPDALRSMGEFGAGFLPPDLSAAYLLETLRPAAETVQLATAGTALALLLGIPLALAAAGSFSLGGPLFAGDPPAGLLRRTLRTAPYFLSRLILNFMRSIPELIWALLFVRAVGLGPTAGVIGLGIAYAGVVGKVFAEILEGTDLQPAVALRAAGASLPKAILYGVLPPAFRTLLSYTLYRWECAMRAAAILGFVGAGGLGQHIAISMRMFEHARTATLILELFLLVALTDILSARIRRRLS